MPILGKSKEEQVKEQEERQFRRQRHQSNLQSAAQQQDDDRAGEILRTLSEVDDLPISPENDEIIGQLVSTLASTANLSEEQVESKEWYSEIIMLLYLCKFPREGGLSGSWRAWARADVSEDIEPISPQKRMQIEAFVGQSKLALTRSEDAMVVKEGARNISESVVNDNSSDDSGGGLLSRL